MRKRRLYERRKFFGDCTRTLALASQIQWTCLAHWERSNNRRRRKCRMILAMKPDSQSTTLQSSLASVGCWLLVLVLGFDLVTSPFHAHSHDIGGNAASVEHASGAGAIDDERNLHAEPTDHLGRGHSLALLLPRPPQPPQTQLLAVTDLPVPPAAQLQAIADALSEGPPQAVEHVPIPSGRYLRPSNRAPPIIHS